jgi:3-phosphoshikimate 1-carboxyvinyltransferase
MNYKISKKNKNIIGEIRLDGSKSISNRVLIIQALCEDNFKINALANSNDTQLMQQLLASNDDVRDAGPAGTTFRFLTAFLSLQSGSQILTGTERMKQRPIGVLVNAMRKLGANIDYLENEGYPPLRINAAQTLDKNHQLTISAGTSSQYISALLLIAPTLPNGLELTLDGKIVSRPYIEMTLNLMAYFGVKHEWDGNLIKILPQKYQAKEFTVEADWSAASYYYAMAAFADKLDLQLNGLFENSVQGDSVLTKMMTKFGVQTTFNEKGVHLSKSGEPRSFFEYDFIRCPDLAQTLFVVCGGLGVQGLFTGLETLKIKETDRIKAMQTELRKMQVSLSQLPSQFSKKSGKTFYQIEGKAIVENTPVFPTYEDHRQAMAIAPLSMLGEVEIEEPMVVRKSYPAFWEDIQKLGFIITKD